VAQAEQISVLITCYQEGDLLRRAFASLAAQTDRSFEVVIVNDASPDAATNAICREIEHTAKARIIWRKTNGGLSAARNNGYQTIAGDICVPLDADDELPPMAIAAIRAGFRRAPAADFLFGKYLQTNVESQERKVVDCRELCGDDGYLDPRRITDNWILLGTGPCRKSAWQRIGGYAEAYSHGPQDVDFFLRLLTSGAKGIYVDEVIYHWHRSQRGMNSTQAGDAFRRVFLANLDFVDKFWDGNATRHHMLWTSLQRGDFATARNMARQLVGRRQLTATTLAVAALPSGITRKLYRLKNPAPKTSLSHR